MRTIHSRAGSLPVSRALPLSLILFLGTPLAEAADAAMKVGDSFRISGGGVVVTGVVTNGTLSVGDPVCVPTSSGEVASTIEAMESFNKVIESAEEGTNVGLLVDGVDPDSVDTEDGVVTIGCERSRSD